MAVRRTAELVDALRVLPDTSRSRVREPLSFVVFDTLFASSASTSTRAPRASAVAAGGPGADDSTRCVICSIPGIAEAVRAFGARKSRSEDGYRNIGRVAITMPVCSPVILSAIIFCSNNGIRSSALRLSLPVHYGPMLTFRYPTKTSLMPCCRTGRLRLSA